MITFTITKSVQFSETDFTYNEEDLLDLLRMLIRRNEKYDVCPQGPECTG